MRYRGQNCRRVRERQAKSLHANHRDPSGNITDATPGVDSGLNVRTIVHEYGGGDYLVGEGAVYFSNFK